MEDFIFQIKHLKSSNLKEGFITDIDLNLKRGEVHALVGDEDFTTRKLFKAISAQENNIQGKAIFNGVEYDISHIRKINKLSFLFQHSRLVETLTVAENIVLDFYPRWGISPFVNWGKVKKNSIDLLEKLNFHVDLKLKVFKLSKEEKKIVNIAKVFYSDPECIIMHDPTEDLSSESVQKLYQVIDKYKSEGKSIIYVTKQWEEALKIADRISVISDGEVKKIFLADDAKRNPQELLNILGKFNHSNVKVDYESKDVLNAVFKAAEFLTSEYELNDVLLLLSKQVTKFMNADGCNIHLIDEGTNAIIDTLEFKIKEDLQAQLKEHVVFNIADKQKSYYTNQHEKDFLSNFELNNKVKTIICVPVLIRARVTAIIQIFYEGFYAHSEEETSYLSAFARNAALAIEDTRLMGSSALLQESHHRIKNNLQSIINIISLQKQMKEIGVENRLNDVLDNIILRIKSIASVHDLLAKDKLGRSIINIKDIVGAIAKFFTEMNTGLKIDLEMDNIFIPYNKATSIALIVNELINNCLKHAFPNKKVGLISVRCIRYKEFVLMSVEDNGVGIPPEFKIKKMNGLGLSIVSSIIEYEFKGKIEFILKEKGTKVEIYLSNEKVFITYKKKDLRIKGGT